MHNSASCPPNRGNYIQRALVDSGKLVPGSMHYLVRHGGKRRTIEGANVQESGLRIDGLYLKFVERMSNRPLVKFGCKPKVLSREKFYGQYPEVKLPVLQRGSTNGGSFIVRVGKP